VPTDKGYRYYVDELMSEEELGEAVRNHIRMQIEAQIREGNVESLLEQVSKVVAEVSQNLGVALAPRFERGRFQRMDAVPLSESKLLLVLTIDSGLVRTMVIEIDSEIRAGDLQATMRSVNERLSGLTVRDIQGSVDARLRSISTASPKLLRLLCGSADSLLQLNAGGDLHFGGTRNFFLQPDFSQDQERIGSLFGLLEDGEPMVSILSRRTHRRGVAITIGGEHASPELQGCSMLTSLYRVGDTEGVVGVIGPRRMPYGRMVPLVQYVAHLTEEVFGMQ